MSKLFTELVAGGSAVEVEFQVADLLAQKASSSSMIEKSTKICACG